MNKKVMAVAVAGALAAPWLAHAQTSTVNIYGSVRLEYGSIDEGANRQRYERLANPGSSFIGFRGEEKLGGDMSAWFQIESTFVGDGANAGSNNGNWADRNTAVGLKGAWGNLFFGQWDTAMNLASGGSYRPGFDTTGLTGVAAIIQNETSGTACNGTLATDGNINNQATIAPGAPTITAGIPDGPQNGTALTTPAIAASAANGLVATGAAAAAAGTQVPLGGTINTNGQPCNATSFRRRAQNSVNYHSPDWNGFQFMASFTSNEETSGNNLNSVYLNNNANITAATLVSVAPQKPRLWSLGATYRNGPFYLGGGYEKHLEYRALAGVIGPNSVGGLAATGPLSPSSAISGTSGVVTTNAGQYGDDYSWNINGAYTWGPVKFGAYYERISYETGNTASAVNGTTQQGFAVAANPGAETERSAWALFVDWNISGAHSLRAGYIDADNSKGGGSAQNSIGGSRPGTFVQNGSGVLVPQTDNGAKMYELMYSYDFSKRTSTYAFYTRLDNDSAGLYRLHRTNRVTGSDEKAFGVGIRHAF